MAREYHIDLGFPLAGPRRKRLLHAAPGPVALDDDAWRLVGAQEAGLALGATSVLMPWRNAPATTAGVGAGAGGAEGPRRA